MHQASNEKQQITHVRKNRTTKSRKNQNAQRKENQQILGNIGKWHHQTSGDERKKSEKVSQDKQKATRDKIMKQEPYPRDKY